LEISLLAQLLALANVEQGGLEAHPVGLELVFRIERVLLEGLEVVSQGSIVVLQRLGLAPLTEFGIALGSAGQQQAAAHIQDGQCTVLHSCSPRSSVMSV